MGSTIVGAPPLGRQAYQATQEGMPHWKGGGSGRGGLFSPAHLPPTSFTPHTQPAVLHIAGRCALAVPAPQHRSLQPTGSANSSNMVSRRFPTTYTRW